MAPKRICGASRHGKRFARSLRLAQSSPLPASPSRPMARPWPFPTCSMSVYGTLTRRLRQAWRRQSSSLPFFEECHMTSHQHLHELPDLRILPIADLLLHEQHDVQRSVPLAARLDHDGVLKNPPIVAPIPDEQRFVV